MTTTQVILLVAGILGANLVLWVPAFMWIRKASAHLRQKLLSDLTGEPIVHGPTDCLYRGASRGSGYPFAKGNGVVVLTERRLIVRKLIGKGVDIPTRELTAVREDKWSLRSWQGGRPNVIVKTQGGHEVGFMVADHDRWMTEVRGAIGRS